MTRLEALGLALGELATSEEWLLVAETLEATALRLPQHRMAKGDSFNRVLAGNVAERLREAAAEIRSNLAIEEMHSCSK